MRIGLTVRYRNSLINSFSDYQMRIEKESKMKFKNKNNSIYIIEPGNKSLI